MVHLDWEHGTWWHTSHNLSSLLLDPGLVLAIDWAKNLQWDQAFDFELAKASLHLYFCICCGRCCLRLPYSSEVLILWYGFMFKGGGSNSMALPFAEELD